MLWLIESGTHRVASTARATALGSVRPVSRKAKQANPSVFVLNAGAIITYAGSDDTFRVISYVV